MQCEWEVTLESILCDSLKSNDSIATLLLYTFDVVILLQSQLYFIWLCCKGVCITRKQIGQCSCVWHRTRIKIRTVVFARLHIACIRLCWVQKLPVNAPKKHIFCISSTFLCAFTNWISRGRIRFVSGTKWRWTTLGAVLPFQWDWTYSKAKPKLIICHTEPLVGLHLCFVIN